MKNEFLAHVRYELVVLRGSRSLRAAVGGTVVLSFTLTCVLVLASRQYMSLGNRQFWALVVTQGGTISWAPFFAYIVSIYSILAWSQDAIGESALVAYASFSGRTATALVRSVAITLVSIALALATVGTALGTALLFAPPRLEPCTELVAVKTLWMVVCAVGFANLSGAMCVLLRSTTGALALLLVVPWIVEPLIEQVVELVAPLHSLAPLFTFLPFKVTTDVVGTSMAGGTLGGVRQLAPASAAIVVAINTTLVIAAAVMRYSRSDGQRDR